MIDLKNVDLDRLKGDVTGALVDGISDLVEGTREDIESYASDISRDLLEAQFSGEDHLNAVLLDQLRVLAEINRVRVENHTLVVVANVVKAILKAAVAGAASVFL